MPEHAAQRGVQEVRRRVVPHRVGAVLWVDARRDLVAHADGPFDDTPAVHDELLRNTLRVLDLDAPVRTGDLAAVADLTAAFG